MRYLKRLWPQVPFGLLLLFIGAVNVLNGLQIQGLKTAYQVLAHVAPISELGQEVSLGILGSGVQVLLGGLMLITGVGLFWRLRSAWAFSILLLFITVAVESFSHRPIYEVLLPGLALIALIIWQSRFDHLSVVGSYLMSFIGILAVFAYGILGAYLLGEEFQPAIHDLYTALYFTVVTLSTVGSNIYPATPEAKLFMVSLILGGISIFTTTIVTTVGPLLYKQIKPILPGRKAKMKNDGHVILIGASSFARSLALELVNHNINFVHVIAPESVPPLLEQPIVRGNPGDETVLKQAGILSARMVIIAGEDDAENASAAQTAKKVNRNASVVIIANSSQAVQQFSSVHADLVFIPAAVGVRLLTNLIRGGSIPKELQDLFEGLRKRQLE
jgi:voltage-gated potassium channel